MNGTHTGIAGSLHTEIDPEACRGYLYLPSDAYGFFRRETSTRGSFGDPQGRGTTSNTV